MSSEATTDEDDRIRQLEERIEQLEAQNGLVSGTVPISRRGLLQGGAALGIGALGGSVLGGGNSGRVAAQTASGQVGTDSSRVDLYGNLVDAAEVSTIEVGTSRLVESAAPEVKTWAEDGSDVDTRLDNAISDHTSGERILLEIGHYTDDRTFTDVVHLVGTTGTQQSGGDTSIDVSSGNSWTLSDRSNIEGVHLRSGNLVLDEIFCQVHRVSISSGSEITVSSDRCVIYGVTGAGSITFESGTSGGEVGAIDGNITVTDNGNNSIM